MPKRMPRRVREFGNLLLSTRAEYERDHARYFAVAMVYYAFVSLDALLETKIPREVWSEAEQFKPPTAIDRWMKKTLTTLLTPIDPEPWPAAHRARRWLMFVRSHWLRMPPHLLIPHLLRKSLRRVQGERVDA